MQTSKSINRFTKKQYHRFNKRLSNKGKRLFYSRRSNFAIIKRPSIIILSVLCLFFSIPIIVTMLPINTVCEEIKNKSIIKQQYTLPFKGKVVITSAYGERVHPITGEKTVHEGIDFGTQWHQPILSVASGKIIWADSKKGYGNCVLIIHKNADFSCSFYAHLSSLYVRKGQQVQRGEVLGREGGEPGKDKNTGNSTGHHLHLEIWNNRKQPINPALFLEINK